MKRIVGIFFASLILSGCATPFNFPSTPRNEPQQKFIHSETFKSEPKIIKVGGEDVYVGDKIEKTYDTGLSQTKPKASIFQKVMALGVGWIILMVLGMFFPPVALVMGIFNRGASKVTSKVVMNVEKALDRMDNTEAKEKFVKTLSENMDPGTKEAVRKIKKTTFNKS